MLCTVYKGSRRQQLYLYVERSQGLEQVPEELLQSMGNLTEVMALNLSRDRKLARVSAGQVLEDINRQGYFLQLPPGDLAGIQSHGK